MNYRETYRKQRLKGKALKLPRLQIFNKEKKTGFVCARLRNKPDSVELTNYSDK